MPYQYKREPLNNDEIDKLSNSCSTFREKFVVWGKIIETPFSPFHDFFFT